MSNKIYDKGFVTGESYQIKDIFSDDRKIVIPDLQRDYCWGSKDERETNRVWKFVNSHYQLFLEFPDSISQIGLIYGYRDLSGRIMLCDGQQRLTTLFLLIGMINRKCEGNPFQNNLISPRELKEDDQEPYLQYAIRETSLSFISNLVTEFFLSKHIANVSDVNTNLFWFYNQYLLDPTVVSMLDALGTMEEFLSELSNDDALKFGQHIVNNLEFMYYDMENRANGEETFVIINTSGEPLTGMENLKPFMVKDLSDCTKWEDMDDWFWKHRNVCDTSTPGMHEFFRWVLYLEITKSILSVEDKSKTLSKILTNKEYTFPYEDISLDVIVRYFEAYKRLNLTKTFEARQEAKVYAWLIPSLSYAKKFENATEEEIQAVIHALKNTTKYRNEYKLNEALTLIDSMQNPDILSWLVCTEELNSYDNRGELSKKLNVIKENINQRHQIELAFKEAEGHGVWHGEIGMLIDWAGGINQFDLSAFISLYNKSVILFGNKEESNSDSCIRPEVLRLLLSYKIANVMMWGRYIKNAGVEWKHFLYEENKVEVFYKLLNNIDSVESIHDSLNTYEDKSNFYYPIIKDKKWLAHSWYRDIRKINTYLAVIKNRCQQKENFKDIFLVGQSELDSWNHPSSWSRFYYNGEYIYIRNKKAEIGINIHGDKQGLYFFIYSTRDDKTKTTLLSNILEEISFESTDDVFYRSKIYNSQESDLLIDEIYKILNCAA